MSALTYEAAKKQVMAAAVPDERRQRAELPGRAADQVQQLPAEVTERIHDAAPELLGQDDVPEAVPGGRSAVHEGRRQPGDRAASQGEFQIHDDHGHRQHADAASDQPGPPQDGRLHRQDEQADRWCQEQRERVIADREGVRDRRRQEPTVGPIASRRVVRIPGPVLPADEEPQQDGDQREVQGVRLGVRADRPGRGCQGHRQAGHHAEGGGPRQDPREIHRDRGGDAQADGREEVHPVGRITERLEDDRGEPGQDDPGREARRVGRAEERTHGLVFAGVPEREAGQQGGSSRREHDDADDHRRDPSQEAVAGHHPSSLPHATPQKLTAIESTTSAMPSGMPQAWRRASRSKPSATRSRANGAKSLLNR
jgi:hypothetical protein